MTAPATATQSHSLDDEYATSAELIERHQRGEQIQSQLIQSPPGAGRGVLFRRLRETAEALHLRVFAPELPAMSLDTPAYLLLQIAALDPDSSEAASLTDPRSGWDERLRSARVLLRRVSRGVLLLRIPFNAAATRAQERRQLDDEIKDVLALLCRPSDSWIVIVAAPSSWRWPLLDPPACRRLTPMLAGQGFLTDTEQWGSLASAATRIHEVLGAKRVERSHPLQMRLAVAAVEIGIPPARIAATMAPGESLRSFEPVLRDIFVRRPGLKDGLERAACARLPVERQALLDIASAGTDNEEILERCFLSPTADVRHLRFPEQLHWCVREATQPMSRSTHSRLFHYYQNLDGAIDPRHGLRKVLPWLEKFHHAALGDAVSGIEGWQSLRPPSREHYWEYGWSLSYVHRHFRAAAAVFETILREIDPDDNYALHYHAYNLDKAGIRRGDAEKGYAKAIEGDPANPWWNARYVSFLTERGKPEAAISAWQAALENVDPDGVESGGDWLPWNLHLHVVRAALSSGNLELARLALEAVREPARLDAKFLALHEQLLALQETRRLREALFPASVPISDWWKPRLLRGRDHLANLRFGRIIESDDIEVVLALGTQTSAVTYHEVSRPEWDKMARNAPPAVGAFIEVATEPDGADYAATELPSTQGPTEDEVKHILRFFVRNA